MAWVRGRRGRAGRGAELVEFAIALPVLVLMMAGIIDFALLFYSYQVTTNAAREGARLAVLPGYALNDYQAARDRVADYARTAGVTGEIVDIGIAPVPLVLGTRPVTAMQVTVTYRHSFVLIGPVVGLIDGSFRDSVTYSTSALMRTEIQNVVPGP